VAGWDPEGEFETLARDLLAAPDVSAGTGFGGSPGVRVDGRIFAMLVRRRLVVKLPAARCQALCEAGVAEALAVGKRVMKEWIEVTDEDRETWRDLAAEAYAFVGGGSNTSA
jgi:TfoX/Sxy family transcriptional regulator of competence genes